MTNTVAVERRMDLASLFCMIGRHGPAVALAVIAMVSVLVGFIIYRTVRRKATAAAAHSDGKSPGAERDASVIQASQEESHSSAESTDWNYEGSSDMSDMKEDVDLIQSDLKIRHRRAAAVAAEKKTPPYCPPKSGIQVPENKHTTSDDTEEMAVVWDSFKIAEKYAEEASQGLPDSYTVAEMVVEDTVDCHQGGTDIIEDVIEEVRDNDSCLKEPEPINNEDHEEEEKVLKAECQEDEAVATDKDVSDKKTRQEEENFQSTLDSLVCFEQTPHMDEKDDDERLQDNKTANSTESNLEQPVIDIEDVPAPGICHGKVEEFEEENLDSIDYSGYSGNNRLPPAEETKNEGKEAGGECVDYQAMAQQAEIWSPTQQDMNHVTGKVAPPIQDSDWVADCGPAGEVIEEVIDEEYLSKHTDVKSDDHSPQFDEQEVEIEQKEENVVTCNQEDVVILSLGADQEKEKMLTSDNSVSCSGEHDSSSVTPPCLSVPLKAASHDDSESGITTDAKAQISGIADFPDLSVDCQQPQKEDKKRPSLDEDTDCTIFVPGIPSHETENPENNRNGTTMVLAKEYNDQVFDPHIPSCPKDQQSDCMENNETFDETRVNSTTDAPACDNATITSPIMSEEIFHLDMLSSSQDQQSDQTKNNEDFSEVTTGAVLVTTKDISPPMCQIHLLSFEQSELRDNDISSPGVGEESGISSMAVSPDLQNPGNEFDLSVENKVLPVMDCDLWSEGKTEAQNSLFADEVAISLINKDTAGFVFGTYTSHHSRASHSEHKDLTGYESFAANEDMFGHEVEDGYHKAMDQFTAEITASLTSFTSELKMQTAMKAFVEVVQIKEKKAGVSVEKKEETEAEKEKEEDYEKTEISIMEATMDNNEWITDCNYQVLPWMNLSTPTFAQDHTKNNQLPTEECQYSSAVTDTTCLNTPDIHPSTQVKQTSTLSLGDANMENNKKVVAVQPMPQNVNVTFRVHYFTQSPYQTVAVTGNQQELGNWKGFIPLERAKNGHWATVVSLPAESNVEWKFVVLDKGEVCRWEECGNRLLDTGCGDDLLVHKWWGLL